jgi:hypothetical protein
MAWPDTRATRSFQPSFEELKWFATPGERVAGILVRDHTDNDFGCGH